MPNVALAKSNFRARRPRALRATHATLPGPFGLPLYPVPIWAKGPFGARIEASAHLPLRPVCAKGALGSWALGFKCEGPKGPIGLWLECEGPWAFGSLVWIRCAHYMGIPWAFYTRGCCAPMFSFYQHALVMNPTGYYRSSRRLQLSSVSSS